MLRPQEAIRLRRAVGPFGRRSDMSANPHPRAAAALHAAIVATRSPLVSPALMCRNVPSPAAEMCRNVPSVSPPADRKRAEMRRNVPECAEIDHHIQNEKTNPRQSGQAAAADAKPK